MMDLFVIWYGKIKNMKVGKIIPDYDSSPKLELWRNKTNLRIMYRGVL